MKNDQVRATYIREGISLTHSDMFSPERSLAVRTYGQVQIFDIKSQITSSTDPLRPPFALSGVVSIRSQDFHGHSSGGIVYISFSPSDRTEMFAVTEKGVGYQCSRREGDKIM